MKDPCIKCVDIVIKYLAKTKVVFTKIREYYLSICTYRVSKLPILDSSMGIGPFKLFDDRFLQQEEKAYAKSQASLVRDS